MDLPNLPGQYLAEVYAHAKLGEPEPGYHYAPGALQAEGSVVVGVRGKGHGAQGFTMQKLG